MTRYKYNWTVSHNQRVRAFRWWLNSFAYSQRASLVDYIRHHRALKEMNQ